MVWVTRDGLATRADSTWKMEGTINSLSLSPDGRSVAVDLLRGAKSDIWVKRLNGGPFSRITFGDTSFVRPTWMPGGADVMFLADRGDGGGVPTVKRADGIGPSTRLLSPKVAMGQALMSADGKWLIGRRVIGEAGNGDIYAGHAGDTLLAPIIATPAREVSPALSPDGKWIAYASDESGVFETYVRPFPNVSSARWQVSTAGGTNPIWSHSGRELFFRNNNGDLVAAAITTVPTFTVGQQRTLFSLTSLSPREPFRFSPCLRTTSASSCCARRRRASRDCSW